MPSDDEILQILKGPGTSNWMKVALSTALNRDPVDAVNDAELLALVLNKRLKTIIEREAAEIEMQLAIKRAKG